MADRYDPKLSVRPLSERRPPAPSDDSDPLVELARIVSGRSTFDPAPQPKAKTVPASPAANGVLSAEPGLANDLESELMNDLQASFAAVAPPPKPAAPPARPAAPPASAAPKPAPAAAPKAPPQPAPAQRPAPQPAGAAPFIPPKVAAPAPRTGGQAQPASAPVARQPAPPVAERPARSAAPPSARPAPSPGAAAKSAPPVSDRPARPAAPPPRAERPATQPPVRPVDRGDFASASLRPTTQVHADPPPLAASAGRWEKPEQEGGEDEASRFAPPRARNWFRANREDKAPAPKPAARAPAPAPEPEITDADHDMFEDAAPTLAEADQLYQDDLALEDIAHYGDDDADLPPLVDELPDMGHRRTSRGLLAVMALLVVALAGGAGYYVLKGRVGGTESPPLIAADPSPTKVVPPDDGSQQTADAQNKLIYDRVDPAAKTTEDATTNLVTPGSEKIADVNKPAETADDGNPVSRVIMQGGPVEGDGAPAKVAESGAEAASGDAAGAAPAAASDTDSLGPKKVRTVVVRPDGTIVSSEAAPADGSAAAAANPAKPPSEVAGGLDMAAHGGTTMDTVLEKGGNIPVNADPLASEGQPAPAPAGTVPAGDGDAAAAAQPSPPAPAPAPTATASADTGDAAPAAATDGNAADAAPAAAAPEPPAKPAAKPKPAVVAKGEPIDLTPSSKAAPAAAPADSAAVTGGLSVQVTSQKSEAAAMSAFRSMQSRYAQVLGRYQPNVQRADLGDRGTYYRVRVGPFAGDGASRVCAALKAAGGDCIIVK